MYEGRMKERREGKGEIGRSGKRRGRKKMGRRAE